MKKATLILIFIVVLSGCAWAYCYLDNICMMNCKSRCTMEGGSSEGCAEVCTSSCMVCN